MGVLGTGGTFIMYANLSYPKRQGRHLPRHALSQAIDRDGCVVQLDHLIGDLMLRKEGEQSTNGAFDAGAIWQLLCLTTAAIWR